MDYEEKYKKALDRAMNLFVTNNISATAVCEIFPELNESEEINYEKKYKKALEWMQSLYDGLHGATKEEAEHYFPELKESEDEKIRKAIIAYISHDQHCGVSNADMIAWLEKQGEKPTDKVEPKFETQFKVGNWITDGYIYYKITEILDDRYIIESKYDKRGAILFEYENRYHLWTIADAKDGDVLDCEGCEYLLFKSFSNTDGRIKLYCWYNVQTNNFHGRDTDSKLRQEANIRPATKEQRDLLFQKMKEAGYEWDSEKKELKKIEPKKLDADKVIAWLKLLHHNRYIINRIIDRFKEDFGLTEKGGEDE